MRRHHHLGALFWFLIGAGAALGGLRYGFGSLTEPGPGLLPVVFGALLAGLSGLLLLRGLIAGGAGRRKPFWLEGGSPRPVVLTFLALVVYVAALQPVGFVVTTFFFVLFLLKEVGGKRWRVCVPVALAFSLFCYGLFSVLLKTPLPKGTVYGSALGSLLGV